jgi:hypothetical protein
MKIKINIPEVVRIFNEIRCQPEKPFEMLWLNAQEMVGRTL